MSAGESAGPVGVLPVFGQSLASPSLSPAEFDRVRSVLYDTAGIKLPDGKQELIKARLSKRLRSLGITSFDEYMDRVASDRSGAELLEMVDLLTTNKTHFFREDAHFAFVAEHLFKPWGAGGASRLRIWSAGCSSGEEPYTLSIVLQEAVPQAASRDARILATDISPTVLQMAQRGTYGAEQLSEAPPEVVRRWFRPVEGAERYQVTPEVSRLVTFRRLNLMDAWPVKGPFDAIFCRNVMIYFDQPTRNRLVARYAELLRPGGLFFCGHAETATGITDELKFIRAGIYQRHQVPAQRN